MTPEPHRWPHAIDTPPGFADRLAEARNPPEGIGTLGRWMVAGALILAFAIAFLNADHFVTRAIEAKVWEQGL
jgi:hypothetical protein